jgi:RNA polymerase sigma factor (sigma-70 family)
LSLESEHIERDIEGALKHLAGSEGEGFVRHIRPIIQANVARKRHEWFMQRNPGGIHDYVACVAKGYRELHPYLHQLQQERDKDAWAPLFHRMLQWAYNYFLRKGFSTDSKTGELAHECATAAAMNLIGAHFPFDTDFDAWAHRIVLNACRKHMQQSFKKSAVRDEQLVDLDENLVGTDDLLRENHIGDLREKLEKALEKLDSARRTVVQLLYFEGLSVSEVAKRMGKTVGSIYNLHFRALANLRKILKDSDDKQG